MPLTDDQRQAFRALAQDTDGIDTAIYQRFEADPLEPIIGLGRSDARVGVFGRDPGRDEVRYGEPFIGAGGQAVRKRLYRALHDAELPDFEASRVAGQDFFWANTVPYKPVGNKAWSMKTKRRFHPLMRELMTHAWQGRDVITLGREAFLWFGIGRSKAERERIEAFWASATRFSEWLEVSLADHHGCDHVFRVYPLPHPSPLNATWYKRFPDLLDARLAQLGVQPGALTIG
ncbi:uracil-DNA glycosylase family protein [uncultured Salinisphaera sp.]|uniref:uracil-DNA glycosylase family protein n=1 Tax=uncultured Salinisphaera sp. TaxID=359372 RepID=UPI0032B22C12